MQIVHLAEQARQAHKEFTADYWEQRELFDKQHARIEDLETRVLALPILTDADRHAAMEMLMKTYYGAPEFADSFRTKLFEKLNPEWAARRDQWAAEYNAECQVRDVNCNTAGAALPLI